jgi:hypothetical protein
VAVILSLFTAVEGERCYSDHIMDSEISMDCTDMLVVVKGSYVGIVLYYCVSGL